MALSALTSSHCIAAHPQSLCNLPHRLRLKVVVQKMNVISGHILWTVVLIHKFSEYLFRSFAVSVVIGMAVRSQRRQQVQALHDPLHREAVVVMESGHWLVLDAHCQRVEWCHIHRIGVDLDALLLFIVIRL